MSSGREHEPATFEEFIAAFDRPGLSESGGLILQSFAFNRLDPVIPR